MGLARASFRDSGREHRDPKKTIFLPRESRRIGHGTIVAGTASAGHLHPIHDPRRHATIVDDHAGGISAPSGRRA